MISHRKIKAAREGGNKDFLEYLQATEYYKAGEQEFAASKWLGKGADVLGLTGNSVKIEQMTNLALGFSPDGSVPLIQNAGRKAVFRAKLDEHGQPVIEDGKPVGRWEGGHVVGEDFTFSPPKPVSVLFAAADSEERLAIVRAQDRAVMAALDYWADKIETRRGKGGKEVIGGEFLASAHLHVGNRDGGAQVHTHVLVYNLIHGEDGQWSTHETMELLRTRKAADALYKAELSHQLQQLGYGVEKRVQKNDLGEETGVVDFSITGIPDTLEAKFSTRRQAILAYMKENGCDAQTACLDTRRAKEEPPLEVMDQLWKQTIDGLREEDPQLFRTTQDLKALGRRTPEPEAVQDSKILTDLHTTDAVFSDHQLIERQGLENLGRRTFDARRVIREVDDFKLRHDLVAIAPEGIHQDDAGSRKAIRHRETRWADRAGVVEVEKKLQRSWGQRQNDTAVQVSTEKTATAVEGFENSKGIQLTDEQRAMVFRTCSQTGGTAVVQGWAGAGKTTAIGAAVAAFQADGREVLGTAIAWDAAKKLEGETGIRSMSTEHLLARLDKGSMTLKKGSVLILDEAGMAGTRTVALLQQRVDQVQGKLVLVGDSNQLQPIEPGAPFRDAQEKLGFSELSQIQRQQGQDRKTSEAYYAKGNQRRQNESQSRSEARQIGVEVLDKLRAAQQIETTTSREKAIQRLAHDHAHSATEDRDKLVIAGSHADLRALNNAIRKEKGLGGKEIQLDTLDHGWKKKLPVAVGERIRFGQRDRQLGVNNGTVGIVEGWKIVDRVPELHVRLESDLKDLDNKKISVKVGEGGYQKLTHAYASTVHAAQGQGKKEVRHLANAQMTDRHWGLVAYTRMKGHYRLYEVEGEAASPEKWGKDRYKVNAARHVDPQAQAANAMKKEQAKQQRENQRRNWARKFESWAQQWSPQEQVRKRSASMEHSA